MDVRSMGITGGSWLQSLGSPMTFRHDIDKSGLNVMTLGIVYEAVMRWVGCANSVIAMGSVFVDKRTDPDTNTLKNVLIPDHLDVACRFGRVQCRMQFSSVQVGVTPANSVYFYGSEGTLLLDMDNSSLRLLSKQKQADGWVNVPLQNVGKWRVEEEFISSIRGAEKVKLTTFEDGVKYMRRPRCTSTAYTTSTLK